MKVAMVAADTRELYQEYEKPTPYFGTPVEALLKAATDLPEFELHVISCWQTRMDAPEKLAPNIWFHGLTVPKIGWLRTGYQGCVRAVRRKVRALQPDIVHGQGTERDCGISAALSGFQNVVTIHGNMRAIARTIHARIGSFLWCAALVEDFTLWRTGGVLCNSAHTESLARPRTRRTWRVPNSLRMEFFSPAPSELPSRKCTLLNIGTITELKQPLQLLKLAAEWHRTGLEFELGFLGKADLQSSYVRRFLEEIPMAEKAGYARYLGMKSGPELVELFDRSHGIIHVPQEEAFGLVVAEGLARNLKLFAFKVGGVSDIAAGVDGAEMHHPNDWTGLSDAVANWIKRGYPRLENASSIMRERYHPHVVAKRHLSIYREVLAAGS